MPYKNTVLQREAVKKAVAKHRVLHQGSQVREVSVEQAAKLLLICKALDKEISGLHGKVNLLDQVRKGSQTFKEIKDVLCSV